MSVTITDFESLVQAAKNEPDPQRMLLVFLKKVLPKDSTEEQVRRFEQGQGGGLEPVFCVDLSPMEVGSFDELVAESKNMETDWHVVLVACLSGKDGASPSDDEAETWLQLMQQSVLTGGDLSRYLAFDQGGQPLHFG